MAGKITRNFRINIASQFKEMFSEAPPNNLYFFVAKSTPWTNETAPDAPLDATQIVDFNIWDDVLALKKISSSDISSAAVRNDWISGQVFQEFNSNVELTVASTSTTLSSCEERSICFHESSDSEKERRTKELSNYSV